MTGAAGFGGRRKMQCPVEVCGYGARMRVRGEGCRGVIGVLEAVLETYLAVMRRMKGAAAETR